MGSSQELVSLLDEFKTGEIGETKLGLPEIQQILSYLLCVLSDDDKKFELENGEAKNSSTFLMSMAVSLNADIDNKDLLDFANRIAKTGFDNSVSFILTISNYFKDPAIRMVADHLHIYGRRLLQ